MSEIGKLWSEKEQVNRFVWKTCLAKVVYLSLKAITAKQVRVHRMPIQDSLSNFKVATKTTLDDFVAACVIAIEGDRKIDIIKQYN